MYDCMYAQHHVIFATDLVLHWDAVEVSSDSEKTKTVEVLEEENAELKCEIEELKKTVHQTSSNSVTYIAKLREYGDGESPIHEGNIEQAYKAAMPFVTMFVGFGVPMYCNMPWRGRTPSTRTPTPSKFSTGPYASSRRSSKPMGCNKTCV
ncbi:hypothetical protein QR680_017184 [Steinernema hermaphroditum]|uniref:Uncharacterized protein n=1 Tax=Steinernema hermaphroditum TaxID=289476 RepID=A0AA39HFM9_9BILA|nr:hypothetical protein QR680_017184 [Steinernema hermaphroditum]